MCVVTSWDQMLAYLQLDIPIDNVLVHHLSTFFQPLVRHLSTINPSFIMRMNPRLADEVKLAANLEHTVLVVCNGKAKVRRFGGLLSVVAGALSWPVVGAVRGILRGEPRSFTDLHHRSITLALITYLTLGIMLLVKNCD